MKRISSQVGCSVTLHLGMVKSGRAKVGVTVYRLQLGLSLRDSPRRRGGLEYLYYSSDSPELYATSCIQLFLHYTKDSPESNTRRFSRSAGIASVPPFYRYQGRNQGQIASFIPARPPLPLPRKPSRLCWMSLLGMVWLVGSATSAEADPPVAVSVEANHVIRDDFLGVGVQWSSYPWWDISDDDWAKVFRRVEFMRLRFARVMLDAFWYCQGFDEDGTPIYDWDTPLMHKLYRLLDWCEQNDVRVMIGEWGRPNGSDLDLASDDPRWSMDHCRLHRAHARISRGILLACGTTT